MQNKMGQGKFNWGRGNFQIPPSPIKWYNVDNFQSKGITMNYTYILRCRDNSLYTGWTNDLTKRVEMHNAGKGAKYTKARLPVELVYYEEHETKEDAMRREYAIKQLSKAEKEKLIITK